jgi:hypothetical protein
MESRPCPRRVALVAASWPSCPAKARLQFSRHGWTSRQQRQGPEVIEYVADKLDFNLYSPRSVGLGKAIDH